MEIGVSKIPSSGKLYIPLHCPVYRVTFEERLMGNYSCSYNVAAPHADLVRKYIEHISYRKTTAELEWSDDFIYRTLPIYDPQWYKIADLGQSIDALLLDVTRDGHLAADETTPDFIIIERNDQRCLSAYTSIERQGQNLASRTIVTDDLYGLTYLGKYLEWEMARAWHGAEFEVLEQGQRLSLTSRNRPLCALVAPSTIGPVTLLLPGADLPAASAAGTDEPITLHPSSSCIS